MSEVVYFLCMTQPGLKSDLFIFIFLLLVVEILPQGFSIITNSCESKYTGNSGRKSIYYLIIFHGILVSEFQR